MIRRRRALLNIAWGVLTGAWAFVGCARSRPRTGIDESPIGSSAPATKQKLAEALERDLARLGKRTNSEEGIPVMLIGENLASDASAGRPPSAERRARAALADSFEQHATLFRNLHPEASASDVGKLVEVLADREFGPSKQSSHREIQ